MRPASVVLALLLLALPLTAQSFPETAVSDVVYVQNRETPLAAGSNGNDFLLVGARTGDLFAHRVTATGELLDAVGIGLRVPRARTYVRQVLGVFWSGDAYTVVISAMGSTLPNLTPATFVARVGGDGHLIVPARQILAGRSFQSAASNGRRIVLGGATLAVLDAEGNVVEESVALPSPASGGAYVASNGSNFLLVWDRNVMPLDAGGHPAGVPKTIPQGGDGYLVASDGNDYVVLYDDGTDLHNDFTQHVGASGQLLQSYGLARLQTPVPNLSLVWNGTTYVVATSAPPLATAMAHKIDRNGQPLESVVVFQSQSIEVPNLKALASNGRQVLAAWGAFDRPRGAVLESDLLVSQSFPLGMTATEQTAPAIATSGNELFVVWQDGDTVLGTRMTLTGQRLDPQPITLSVSPSESPRVAWDGQAYVVVSRFRSFSNSFTGPVSYLSVTRVARDGTIKSSNLYATPRNCGGDFDVASNGQSSFIVGVTSCSAASDTRVYGLRIDGDQMVGTWFPISPADMVAQAPRVAWNGTNYLVAWNDILTVQGIGQLINYYSDVWAARVAPSMSVLDPAPIQVALNHADDPASPRVASDGNNFMVAWTRTTDAFADSVRIRTVDNAGIAGNTMEVGAGKAASLIWDGQRYALAVSTPAGNTIVRRVGADSAVSIEVGDDASDSAALTSLGNGGAFAAYVRVASEPVYGTVRRVLVKSVGTPTRPRPVRAR